MDIAAIRESYELAGLGESDLAPTWLQQLQTWLEQAAAAELREPNAMVLATADAGGRPAARTVLLRGLDERGLGFYTNLQSRKGLELAANPRATAVFGWYSLQRQVTVEGDVEPIADADADAYFASRPRGHQLGALASPQSQVIGSREQLDAARAALESRYPEGEAIARPPTWGGRRLVPHTVEFWQGRRDRLHDRLRYRLTADGWTIERVAP